MPYMHTICLSYGYYFYNAALFVFIALCVIIALLTSIFLIIRSHRKKCSFPFAPFLLHAALTLTGVSRFAHLSVFLGLNNRIVRAA